MGNYGCWYSYPLASLNEAAASSAVLIKIEIGEYSIEFKLEIFNMLWKCQF